MRGTSSLTQFARLAALAVVAACAGDSTGPGSRQSPSLSRSSTSDDGGGVYTMTNGAASNAIVAFHRAEDGTLSPLGEVVTGGRGTGGTVDPLVSQYSIVLSRDDDNRLLYAVNAGSNDITSFRVAEDGTPTVADRVASGGVRPTSVAVHHRLLYVLNAGDNSVVGFRAAASGQLIELPGGHASLAAGTTAPAAIRFTLDGRYLIVSERGSQTLEVFPVGANGRLGAGQVTRANGAGTFGFDVTPDNKVLVSETMGAAPNGAVSSYSLSGAALQSVTRSLDAGGRATCWLIATTDGRFAFAANSGSSALAFFRVARNGVLTANGSISTGAGSIPLDLDVADDNRFVYVLQGGNGNVGAFAVTDGGSLTSLGEVRAGAGASGLQGLASF